MVIDNPLVKDTAQQTAGEVIHSLQYMAYTLPIPSQEDEEGEVNIVLNRQQMCGLRNLIECNQAAMESCYYQIGRELNKLNAQLKQLEQVNTQHSSSPNASFDTASNANSSK